MLRWEDEPAAVYLPVYLEPVCQPQQAVRDVFAAAIFNLPLDCALSAIWTVMKGDRGHDDQAV